MKLLIVAFKFPPYGGVGSFRWAKLSKYLAKNGHKVKVISVDWNKNSQNNLYHDIVHKNISIERISSGYPQILNIEYLNIIFLIMLKLFYFEYLILFSFGMMKLKIGRRL